MKKAFTLISVALAALCAFSCQEKEEQDDPFKVSEGVLFDIEKMKNNLTVSLCDDGEVTLTVLKSGKGQEAGDAKVEIVEELVATYNAKYSTSYVALPSSGLSLSGSPVQFEATDKSKTVTVSWDVDSTRELVLEDENIEYVIPVKITESSLRISDGADYVLVRVYAEAPVIPEDQLILEKATLEGEAIMGCGNGLRGKWKILKNEDYSILIDRPTFSLPASPYNLFDGDLTSKNGTWFAKFDSMNDDPIVFEVDLEIPVAPAKFYVQHFTDTQSYTKFNFYLAKEYNGEDTEWTLVASTPGGQGYMPVPDFDFQSEIVNNANGPTDFKCYQLTYGANCTTTMYARYMKIEIFLPEDLDTFANGKGKLNEIYMKGIYEDPDAKPEPLRVCTGPWEVLEGNDLGHGAGKDSECEAAGWYRETYPASHLVDGVWGITGDNWYTGTWCSWWTVPVEYPMTFVFDMEYTYMPGVMHTVDAHSHQGQWRNFDFYVADEYDAEHPENTEWTLICEGRREGWEWVSGGVDYSYDVTNPTAGRYLRVDILNASRFDGDYENGRGYLAEIYFEGECLGGGPEETPEDPETPETPEE